MKDEFSDPVEKNHLGSSFSRVLSSSVIDMGGGGRSLKGESRRQ